MALTKITGEGVGAVDSLDVTGTGGRVTVDANGHITSKQSLDAATAGGRIIGASNRGTVSQIDLAQTTSSADGGYIRFLTCDSGSTNPTERMRLLSGGGLTFNGDTAAANALSDYEEGTFEPTFTSSGGDFTSAGYNADTGGRYIKIGNLVLVTGCARLNGTLDKSNVSGSANLRIGNLPFNNSARSNGDNADGPHTIRVPVWSSGDVPDRSNMNPGANAMTLYKQNTDNNVAEVITVTDLPNDAMVQFSATYTTN